VDGRKGNQRPPAAHCLCASPRFWLCASVAAVSSVIALDVLAQLERELLELRAHVATFALDRSATNALGARLVQLDATRRSLRECVIACIAAGTAEWSGTVMQTRTLVVLAELSMLSGAAREMPPDARLFGDAFPSVEALRAYVVRGVERVMAGLERERHLVRSITSIEARTALEQVAFGNAECGFLMLGRDERLVRALRSGARVPSLRFALACRTLLLTLGAHVDPSEVIPDLPGLRRSERPS
jgi:hypothetical protein